MHDANGPVSNEQISREAALIDHVREAWIDMEEGINAILPCECRYRPDISEGEHAKHCLALKRIEVLDVIQDWMGAQVVLQIEASRGGLDADAIARKLSHLEDGD